MKFIETKISGVYIVELDLLKDERGFFARTWDEKEAVERGLQARMVQSSTSFNQRAGTLRGMHYQEKPHTEAKLVRCTQGALYDVAVDLRHDSPTYLQWVATELNAENRRALYIAKGCAHGFQTLSDATEILYMMSEYFNGEASRGVRWNDPAFKIDWPEVSTRIVSPKDQTWPDWKNA